MIKLRNTYILLCFMGMIIAEQNLNAQTINFTEFADGFSSPVDITHAGDERLFVVERRGYIHILNEAGEVNPTPFLDIDNIVYNAGFQDERGLLGLAFHPDYANNGYFYLNYIDNQSNTNIVRYTVSADDPNVADVNSRKLILFIDQPAGNHNGGCIKFGPDGYLYIGMGDGGAADDPWNNSQTTTNLLGKMLRIDIDNGDPYSIPEDNPFVDTDFILDEIWAYGLRNPWRFSFDRETGDLWIADVGQNQIEEIDFQSADSPGGENYGWRCYEGNQFTFNDSQADCMGDYTSPVYEIEHMGFSGPCSITGGFVYRGNLYSELVGKYFSADYCTGQVFVVEQDENGNFSGSEVTQINHAVSSFGQDINGELYIASFASGRILRLEGEPSNVIEHGLFQSVSIQPNPIQEFATIRMETDQRIYVEFEVLSLDGRLIYENGFYANGLHEEKIDMSTLPAGTYLFNVNSQDQTITRKIVKL